MAEQQQTSGSGRIARLYPTQAGGIAQRLSLPHVLLAMGVLTYLVVFAAAAIYKYHIRRMGFDLAVHEQVLWNTIHGRVAATSAFAHTESYFGIDIILTELLLAPFYALLPATHTMLVLQTLATGLGALPVFLIVRDRWRSPWAGLAFAAAYLLYLPVQYTNLYEFQIRAFATTFLLCAFYALERRRAGWFWIWALLALGCRSEAGFVLAGMGLYALYDERYQLAAWLRRGVTAAHPRAALTLGVLPVAVGMGWFVLCLLVLIPAFREPGAESLYLEVIYGQFGDSAGAIAHTLLTQPGRVFAYVFLSDRGPERVRYLIEMFLPFGFLLLLQPRLLLITLPIFALNLLSNTPNIHASVRYHYQTLIVPFMVAGSAYGLHWLLERARASQRARLGALAGLVALALGCNLAFRNPFVTLLTIPVDHQRNAAARQLLEQVPPGAPLTTTNTIGPYAARREQLYFFPGNVIYPAEKVERGEYLLIDEAEAGTQGMQRLEALAASGRYRLIDEQHGVSLWRRVEP